MQRRDRESRLILFAEQMNSIRGRVSAFALQWAEISRLSVAQVGDSEIGLAVGDQGHEL